MKKRAGERIVLTINDIDYAFRWCPPGTFTMGSPTSEKDRSTDETPSSPSSFGEKNNTEHLA